MKLTQILTLFNLSEFNTTDTELKAIAAPANHGARKPSMAKGIIITLYRNAQSKFCFIFVVVFLLIVIASTNRSKSPFMMVTSPDSIRSEERRVGKECNYLLWTYN